MPKISRLCLSLLLLTCLLVACNAPAANGNQTTTPVTDAKKAISPTPIATQKDIQGDTCPGYLHDLKGCLTPHALRVAYGVEPLYQKGYTGKGQTIIDIVSFGSPTLQQDMDIFDKQFGLPPVNLQIISPLTVAEYDPRGDKPGWADETTLDVQIFHALAPDAKIVVLTSPVAETQGTIGLPEFRQLLQYSMDKKLGHIVSQSWGASELTLQDATGQQELARWNTLFEKGTTQQGITFLASSGDNGSTDYADIAGKTIASVPTTSFPADSPWVTTVGGTTVNKDSAGSYSEIAWSKSGGGFSRFYKTPAYQQNGSQAVKEQLANRRGVPDVSGAADPYTGMAIYINGQWTLAGGTSASAPLWAGVVAVGSQMANRPLGFLNPGLYKIGDTPGQNAQDFRDIIQGNNTNANVPGYSAVPGWDPVTGLGSPLADKLLPDLIQETRADAGDSSAPAMERG